MKKLKRPGEEGFTLVELMVTLAIIGVLMAIAIPNYLTYMQRGGNGSALSEATNFYRTALVEVSDSLAAETFGPANFPVGFTNDADVTITGTMRFDAIGNVTAAPLMTFSHNKGNSTYTLAVNGTVTGS